MGDICRSPGSHILGASSKEEKAGTSGAVEIFALFVILYHVMEITTKFGLLSAQRRGLLHVMGGGHDLIPLLLREHQLYLCSTRTPARKEDFQTAL